MEKSNDKAKKVNKFNMSEIKLEYNGKVYSFNEAVNEGIVSLKEKEGAFGEYQPYSVNYENVFLIVGGTKFKLKDCNIGKLVFDKNEDICNIVGFVFTNDNNTNIEFSICCIKNINNKKYFYILINDSVEAIFDNKICPLTETIIVDVDTGKIVGGTLDDNNKKKPIFSWNINGNKIDVEKAGEIDVFTKDGKIDSIHVVYPANIKFNNKDIFMPDEKFGYIDITKIDKTIFADETEHSGINFLHCFATETIPDFPNIDKKYANAGILNLEANDKTFKHFNQFDYTVYDDGEVLIKYQDDDNVYALEPYNDNEYQVINKYILPEDEEYKGNTLSSCTLRDEGLLDFINDMNKGQNDNKDVNNQSVDTNELSKCYSNNKGNGFEKK